MIRRLRGSLLSSPNPTLVPYEVVSCTQTLEMLSKSLVRHVVWSLPRLGKELTLLSSIKIAV